MCRIVLIIVVTALFAGCVDEPDSSGGGTFIAGESGAVILCEGIKGSDNSTITRIDFQTGSYSDNYFSEANSGQKTGDIANDLILRDSIAYIAVSKTGTIEAFSMNTGRSIGRIYFPANVWPRKMVFISDTLAYVTTYIEQSNDDFYVYGFNPEKLKLTGVKIQVGSHPEGMALYDNKLYVVNSGYGDLHFYHPKASTISVIDLDTKTEVNNIKTGNNPNRIWADGKGKIYVAYWELPSKKDFGGIIEYDAVTMEKLREWKTMVYDFCLNKNSDTLYYLSSSINTIANNSAGVNYIALDDANAVPRELIKNEKSKDMWSAIAINHDRNELWVASAFDYQTAGNLMVYSLSSPSIIKNTYKTGIIPNTIRFY